METILYVTAEVLRNLALMAQPVIPTASVKLLDLLGIANDARNFTYVGAMNRLVSGAALPAPAPIFPRYVEAEGEAKA
jgi:methionyl-tRNA synthetase